MTRTSARSTDRTSARSKDRSTNRDPDEGSSVAEFAMVLALLMMLFLGLVQLCLWFYTRNLLISASAQAARYAANADVDTDQLTSRVLAELGSEVADGVLDSLRCTVSRDGELIGVHCELSTPGLVGALDGVLPDISVDGHTVVEAR